MQPLHQAIMDQVDMDLHLHLHDQLQVVMDQVTEPHLQLQHQAMDQVMEPHHQDQDMEAILISVLHLVGEFPEVFSGMMVTNFFH